MCKIFSRWLNIVNCGCLFATFLLLGAFGCNDGSGLEANALHTLCWPDDRGEIPPSKVVAAVADLHFNSQDGISKNSNRSALEHADLMAPDFILDLGDTVTDHPARDGHWQLVDFAAGVFRQLRSRVVSVAGNHDVGHEFSFYAPNLYVPLSHNPTSDWLSNYERLLNPINQVIRNDQVVWLTLDVQSISSDLPEAEAQWGWLNDMLSMVDPNDVLIVNIHIPLFWESVNDLSASAASYDSVEEPGRSRLLDMLSAVKTKKTVILSGHTHWPIRGEFANMLLYTFPSAGFQRDHGFYANEIRFPNKDLNKVGYGVVSVHPNVVQIRRIYHELWKPDTLPIIYPGVPERPARSVLTRAIRASFLATAPLLPQTVSSDGYAASNLVDGHKTEMDSPEALRSWSSLKFSAPNPGDHQWVLIRSNQPVTTNQIALFPDCINQRVVGFPENLNVEISMDGIAFTPVTQTDTLQPLICDQPVLIDIPEQVVRSVRLTASILPEIEKGVYAFRLAEVELWQGGNCIAAGNSDTTGLRATASSAAWGKPRRNDTEWMAAEESGAGWIGLDSVGVWDSSASKLMVDPGFDHVVRSLNVPDVKLIGAIDLSGASGNPQSIASAAAGRYQDRIYGWRLDPSGITPETVTSIAAIIATVVPSAKVLVGPLNASDLSNWFEVLLQLQLEGSLEGVVVNLPPIYGSDPYVASSQYDSQVREVRRRLFEAGIVSKFFVGNFTSWVSQSDSEVDRTTFTMEALSGHIIRGDIAWVGLDPSGEVFLTRLGDYTPAFLGLQYLSHILSDHWKSQEPIQFENGIRGQFFENNENLKVIMFSKAISNSSITADTFSVPFADSEYYGVDPLLQRESAVMKSPQATAIAVEYPRFLILGESLKGTRVVR